MRWIFVTIYLNINDSNKIYAKNYKIIIIIIIINRKIIILKKK